MDINLLRQHYAEEVMQHAGLHDPVLQRAFSIVPREQFFGPGPWKLGVLGFPNAHEYRYITTSSDAPSALLHDVTVALDADTGLLSASPSSLALAIHHLGIKPGQTVLHIGAGVGYYSAVLREVLGDDGFLHATEASQVLADKARTQLSHYKNVAVAHSQQFPALPAPVNGILINAGVTHVEPAWLEALALGGRLVLPLTIPLDANVGAGALLKVEKTSEDECRATFVGAALCYSALGLRDRRMEVLLQYALSQNTFHHVNSLQRRPHQPCSTCVLHRPGACLSSLAPATF